MIKIDITVKKNDEPSSVEIRDDKWLELKPRVERALKIGIGDESNPAITERARIDLEKISTYLLSKNIKIEWSPANAKYQVKIKNLQNSTELWLFFGNRGVNKSVPSKSVGKSEECASLLQLIQEALK